LMLMASIWLLSLSWLAMEVATDWQRSGMLLLI
jgi:hypothetical protein